MIKNRLKAIREEQLLDREFVCDTLGITIGQCKMFEDGSESLPDSILLKFERLYGVSKKDIYMDLDSKVNVSKLGMARSYDKLSLKDHIAIARLVNIRNAYNS